MKTLLPKTSKGFTLIELLVVIAILAILAVIGFAAFRGFTGRGNDARRSADLKAVGDALETAKGTYYVALATNQFASGSIPIDPTGGAAGNSTHGGYCISYSTTGIIGTAPSLAQLYTGAGNACNGTGVAGFGANGVGWSSVATGVPTGNVTIWMACGATGDPQATVVCRNSAQ